MYPHLGILFPSPPLGPLQLHLINTQSLWHWKNFGIKISLSESPLVAFCSEAQLEKHARNDPQSQNDDIMTEPTAKSCHSTESVKWYKNKQKKRARENHSWLFLCIKCTCCIHQSISYKQRCSIEAVQPKAKIPRSLTFIGFNIIAASHLAGICACFKGFIGYLCTKRMCMVAAMFILLLVTLYNFIIYHYSKK